MSYSETFRGSDHAGVCAAALKLADSGILGPFSNLSTDVNVNCGL